ncbi:hypothetical protein N2152v2_004869 [Parachlorella kessleri]
MRRAGYPALVAAAVLSCLARLGPAAAAPARALLQVQPGGSGGVGFPEPVAYFPLLNGSLASAYPEGAYQGVAHNIGWDQEDPEAGSVLVCDKSQKSYVSIPGLQYGQGGDFAISYWAKMHLVNGSAMEYMYSHNSTTTTAPATGANQVQVFAPERNHDSYGVVRVILRDSNDRGNNGTMPFFLDSDGCVSNPGCPGAVRNISMFADNGTTTDWHLVTVTTQGGKWRGYRLFIDGQLAAEVAPGVAYVDGDGYAKAITGGDPILLDGDIVLCGRADLNQDRFFNGHIANLMIFNTSLSAEQVAAIYTLASADSSAATNLADAAKSTPDTAAPAGRAAGNTTTGVTPDPRCSTPCRQDNDIWICSTAGGTALQCQQGGQQQASQQGAAAAAPAVANGTGAATPAADCVTACQLWNGVQMCATQSNQLRMCSGASSSLVNAAGDPQQGQQAATGSTPAPAPQTAAATLSGMPLCSVFPIPGLATLSRCPDGSTCNALSSQQIATTFGGQMGVQVGTIGVCAYRPQPIMLPNVTIAPPPMAFFPLSGQTLESFPLPDYHGVNQGATMEYDPLFGTVLRCSKTDKDVVALDPVQYARSGAFTVNLWFRPMNMSGSLLSYMFSHMAASNSSQPASAWGPNQVHVYLPERAHVDYGILRTIVRDMNDTDNGPQSQVFIDSDGAISYDGPRQNPSPLMDGQWHMVTLSSQPTGGRGFRLYIDGQLVNQMKEGVSYSDANGQPLLVTGGGPMLLSGNVVLCSRADADTQRHFDGQLAYLGLYDTALNEVEVGALFDQVDNQRRLLAQNSSAAAAPAPPSEQIISRGQGSTIGPIIQRTSVTGKACQLPALYQGALTYDCVTVSGQAFCQVDSATNTWEQCDLGGGASAQHSGSPAAAARRYTVTGEECVLPTLWQGQQVNDCVAYQGKQICQVASGDWEVCAPPGSATDPSQGASTASPDASPAPDASNEGAPDSPAPAAQPGAAYTLLAANGEPCRLPLKWNGATVDSCVSMQGELWCWGDKSDTWTLCDKDTARYGPMDSPQGTTAAASSFRALPTLNRVATSGQSCVLPTVVDDTLYTDCADPGSGVPSCLTPAGDWATCDLSNPAGLPLGTDGQLQVADRATVTGSACLLPAVYHGFVWFDCLDASVGNSSVELCPNTNSTWEVCQPLTSVNATRPFSTDFAFNRTQPGQPGMVCTVQPALASERNCAPGLSCYPLPDMGGNTSSVLAGLGFCSPTPVGGTFGIYPILQGESLPTPLAHFPLTGGYLGSLLLPPYSGDTYGNEGGPSWVNDTKFGSVVSCNDTDLDAVVLDNVPYGLDGSFAISLWMRRLPDSNFSGDAFQYIYSHSGIATAAAYSPNQVQLYIADKDHPAYGLVRAIVKDESDTTNALVYLDSDGRVNDNSNRTGREPRPHADLNDGRWHMITLSTFPNDTKGYTLFVDGREVGSLASNVSASALPGAAKAPGGDPALMTDSITLCARSDFDVDRFYDGSVAHLMLFNDALAPDQVATLYQIYGGSSNQNSSTVQQAGGGGLEQSKSVFEDSGEDPGYGGYASSSSSGLSTGAVVGIVVGSAVALALLVAGLMVFVSRGRRRRYEEFTDTTYGGAGAAGGVERHLSHSLSGMSDPGSPTMIQLSHGNSLKLYKDLSTEAPAGELSGSFKPSPEAVAGLRFTPPPPSRPAQPPPTPAGSETPMPPPEAAGGGGGGSVASRSLTEDVEVDTGKRGMLGFGKKKAARIILPGSMDSAAGPGPDDEGGLPPPAHP